jgi:hypothetical protein
MCVRADVPRCWQTKAGVEMTGSTDRRITARRVFSIGTTIALIQKIAFRKKANLFYRGVFLSRCENGLGGRLVRRPPSMTHTHVSKGCGSLAGYPNADTGCCLNQRFVALTWFRRKDFANPSRNFASVLRQATSQASRVATSPSESRISWGSETLDLADDRRSEAAASRNVTISAGLAR